MPVRARIEYLVDFRRFRILPETKFVWLLMAKSATPKSASKKSAVVPKPRILVASTVYNFEDQLSQVCGVLTGFGYDVWNSHIGTIPVNPGLSNSQSCLAAVDECDLFLGIIRPTYGSGVVGERSITHDECLRAIEKSKPRWFMVHHDVAFARQLLKPYLFDDHGQLNTAFNFQKTRVLDDRRVIDLYNDALQSDVPVEERRGHWVQEFYRQPELLSFVNSQFADLARIRTICEEMSQP